uniref:GST C-terminal domain-containing protein n=1 Tax=Timema shepardi TaxID=629360 RepID=A0A7R9AW89_TIMSH|nr:unnamed protein product [Timema shepardi]
MIGAHMLDLAGLKEEKRIEVERKKQEQEDRNKIKNQSEEFQANRKVLENKSQTAKEAMPKENRLEKQESEAKEEVQSYKSLLAEANERINNAMKINDRKGDTPRLIPLDLGPEVRQKVTQFRNAFELIPAGAITMGSFLHPEFIQSPRLPFIQPVRSMLNSRDLKTLFSDLLFAIFLSPHDFNCDMKPCWELNLTDMLLALHATCPTHYWPYTLLALHATCPTRYWPYTLLALHATGPTRYWPYTLLALHATGPTRYLPYMLLALHATCPTRYLPYTLLVLHATCPSRYWPYTLPAVLRCWTHMYHNISLNVTAEKSNSRNLRELAENNPEAREILLRKAENQDTKHAALENKEEFKKVLHQVDVVLDNVEKELSLQSEDKANHWLCCERFTVADVSLTILLDRLARLGLATYFWGADKKPYLKQYYHRVQLRDSYKKTVPSTLLNLKMLFMMKTPLYIGIGVVTIAFVVVGGVFLFKKSK